MDAEDNHHPPTDPGRRRLLLGAAAGLGGLGAWPAAHADTMLAATSMPDPNALLDDLSERTFRFFWETTDPRTGLAPDRWPSESCCSIAAVGFALTAYPIGASRGWITRGEARQRVLTTLRFLNDAPQGPERSGRAGYKGFFYHFLDMKTGARYDRCELSTVDTALLLAGALFCQSWFDEGDKGETEIRALVESLVTRVDWRWAQARAPSIALGWRPEGGFLPYDWKGYNEAMILYLLALGAPKAPIDADAWQSWTSTYDEVSWAETQGSSHLGFAPLFGHQYSHVWIDFRGIRDEYMRARGLDYFENSRRATYAQRAYAVANPLGWQGYGRDSWGITACDGPADVRLTYRGSTRRFRSYAGRGAGGIHTRDDGTLAPTAAMASLPFAPEAVIPALAQMRSQWGDNLYSKYGFVDAFNPSFDYNNVPLRHGKVVPGAGWFDTDYLGIDQGPIVAMLANYRDNLVWKTMRSNPHLQRGLKRAGFTGGWLEV